jgi:hypothetical protein
MLGFNQLRVLKNEISVKLKTETCHRQLASDASLVPTRQTLTRAVCCGMVWFQVDAIGAATDECVRQTPTGEGDWNRP